MRQTFGDRVIFVESDIEFVRHPAGRLPRSVLYCAVWVGIQSVFDYRFAQVAGKASYNKGKLVEYYKRGKNESCFTKSRRQLVVQLPWFRESPVKKYEVYAK